jgi:hypothetical protein
MARDKTRDLRKMGRRNFLKTLAGIGVSAGSLRYLSKEALAEVTDKPEDVVPVLQFMKKPDNEEERRKNKGIEDFAGRIPVYEAVPRDRWMKIEAIHNAARKLNNRLSSISEPSPEVGVTMRTNGHNKERILEVKHVTYTCDCGEGVIQTPGVSYDSLTDKIPASVSGTHGKGNYERVVEDIPVVVKEVTAELQNYYTNKYRPVPGGCKMIGSKMESSYCDATIGFPAEQGYNQPVWVTAAHNVSVDMPEYTTCKDEQFYGDDVYQPDESNSGIIGGAQEDDLWWFATNHGPDEWGDVAVLRNIMGNDAEFDMASDSTGQDYMGWELKGTSSVDRLKDKMSSLDITVQGITTGRQTGSIYGLDNNDYQIQLSDVDTEGGDSGGPYFELEPDELGNNEVLAVGIHSGSNRYSPADTFGSIFKRVENNFGIAVGASW